MASAMGQNVIFDNPTVKTEYSVIRNYNREVDISYDLEGGIHCFNYHDLSTLQTYNVQVPYWFDVLDFKIMDDTVYFCGNNDQTSRAKFGWFDIHSVFFGVGTIYYKSMPITYHVDYPSIDTEIVHSFARMGVFKISGHTHLYLVGDGYRLSDIFNSNTDIVATTGIPRIDNVRSALQYLRKPPIVEGSLEVKSVSGVLFNLCR